MNPNFCMPLLEIQLFIYEKRENISILGRKINKKFERSCSKMKFYYKNLKKLNSTSNPIELHDAS